MITNYNYKVVSLDESNKLKLAATGLATKNKEAIFS